jgi:hypothetical protein
VLEGGEVVLEAEVIPEDELPPEVSQAG